MSKRAAGFQLTAENFEREDEHEEEADTGEFSKASDQVISKRVIKKARRRNNDALSSEVKAPSNPFTGFAGFGSAPSLFGTSKAPSASKAEDVKSAASVAPTFGISPSFATSTNGNTLSGSSFAPSPAAPFKPKFVENATCVPKPTSSLGDKEYSVSKPASNSTDSHKGFSLGENSPKQQQSKEDEKSDVFVAQLTELNNSVLSWIKQHIDENPLIDLTPVFADYKKYMEEIEEKYGTPKTASKPKISMPLSVTPVTAKETETKSLALSTTPLFGSSLESKSTVGLSSKMPVAGFFSMQKTSTPAIASSTTSDNTKDKDKKTNADEDEEEVPKVERKTIVEADAFHTIRCKLFFKKGQEWKELGIGMLYLKPLNNKTQLLVRMETSGGNIILNICLHPSLPCSRVGKNNVSIVSVPNPPIFVKPNEGDNSKPVTYLIRVKGTAEADELAKIIDDKKGSE
eukprot:gene18084-19891_t